MVTGASTQTLVQPVAASPPQPSMPPAVQPQPTVNAQPIAQAKPVTARKHHTLLWVVIGAGAVLGMGILAAVGAWSMLDTQKKEIKQVTTSQVTSLGEVENIYKDIVAAFQAESGGQNEQGTNLLGVSDQKALGQVLGVEDSQAVQEARKVSENYKKAISELRDIESRTEKAAAEANKLPAKFVISGVAELVTKTTSFADESTNLLTYLDAVMQLDIQQSALGYELGVAINDSIQRGADESSVKTVEDKMMQLRGYKTKYVQIDTSKLSDDVKAMHQEKVTMFESDVKLFEDILSALRARNVDNLVNSIRTLLVQAESRAQSESVKIVSFWQNNATLRSVSDIKKEWQSLSDSLK